MPEINLLYLYLCAFLRICWHMQVCVCVCVCMCKNHEQLHICIFYMRILHVYVHIHDVFMYIFWISSIIDHYFARLYLRRLCVFLAAARMHLLDYCNSNNNSNSNTSQPQNTATTAVITLVPMIETLVR